MSVDRLLVVSHVPHYVRDGSIYAYAPYVRELELWCDLFQQVEIASPIRTSELPGDCTSFSHRNVHVRPIPESGGHTLVAKLWQAALLPWIVVRLCTAMLRADAIHVRCPGNLGLLGVLLGPIFSRRLIAKYAGQWNDYPGEARTVRLQRRLLASRWWRGPVTVYGKWPNQPDHVVPFFTSVMSSQQMDRARELSQQRSASSALRVVFVGRLSAEKNVDVLLRAIARVVHQGVDANCTVVGHGAQENSLSELAISLGIDERVQFLGGVDHDRVLECYGHADVLVLASETEGWPKVIAEAMACGVVCVGSDRGLIPWMLSGGRGFTVEPGDADQLARVLCKLASSPQKRLDASGLATEFGQRYSLDSLRDALAELMSERWATPIRVRPQGLDTSSGSDNRILAT